MYFDSVVHQTSVASSSDKPSILIFLFFYGFSFMNEIIVGLSKAPKSGGKVAIADATCYKKGQVNDKAEEVISRMKSHGFYASKHGRKTQV